MTYVINGPNGGYATIFGNTSGSDVINAFDFYNTIISGGADDQIYTGQGFATVNLGAFAGVTDTVNVGGAFNTIFTAPGGHVGSTLTVQGGTGHNSVTLQNAGGINSVSLQGMYNVITVNGKANNLIFAGAGHDKVTVGYPNDGAYGYKATVNAAGTNNTVLGGDESFQVVGGQGYDAISLGNGNNSIVESGSRDRITLGTGSNTVTDYGGAATLTFLGTVFPPGTNQLIKLGGTNNTVTEMNWAFGSARNFNITVTNGGHGSFILGNGLNKLVTDGDYNYIQMGTPWNKPAGYDSVQANGNSNTIQLGNGNNVVQANGANDWISLGNGANSVTANGINDILSAGNGNNNVFASGAGDNITLGDGNNGVTANGDHTQLTIGNGSNAVNAGGNGDTIALGTGNNTVNAGGNNDVITSAGGKGSFTIGSSSSLTLTASSVGTTVNSTGMMNSIELMGNANASISDSPMFGGEMSLQLDATAGSYAGNVSVTGFQNDPLGMIDLHGFAGITNFAQLQMHSSSDGAGGTLIHLGAGSLDLVATATLNQTQFSFV